MNPRSAFRQVASIATLLAACSQISAIALVAPPPVGAFLSGGVGQEEQSSMRSQKAAYNLRLAFATSRSGEYLAGLDVSIEGVDHKASYGPYADCGPLFFMRVAPGIYRVKATYDGVVHSKTIRVGNGGAEDTLYWP